MGGSTGLGIPYGIADFRRIRNEGYYYVDKSEYLAKMEARDSFVFFVCPRRFGKSLFLDMLRLYYDRNEKANFGKLFGGLWIGAHPTPNRNRYMTLALDLSKAGATGGRSLQECFDEYLSYRFDDFVSRYPDVYDEAFLQKTGTATALGKFMALSDRAHNAGIPIYLIIDEYDNFTNVLIRSAGSEPYKSITHGTGFYREWFKKFKGSVDRIFMTGVSPVDMVDPNIATDYDKLETIVDLQRQAGAQNAEDVSPLTEELARDTTLHLILFQFKGAELVRLEEIAHRTHDSQEWQTLGRADTR